MATPDNPQFDRDAPQEIWPGTPPEASRRPRADTADESGALGSFDLEIPTFRVRPYVLTDIPGILRFRGALRLDVPDSLVGPGAALVDLPAALPILRRERPSFVATADGHPVGLIRFSPRAPDGRWVLKTIAASTGVYAREPVWEGLLAHGVRAAGLRGVRRLFARIPTGHPIIGVMRGGGWVPYATESVFRAERLTLTSRPQREVRPQEPADTWAIHQLYAACVPRKVQEVEALTSHFWHMDTHRRPRRGIRQTGWILEEGDRLVAYARYLRGPRAGMIDVVVAPGASGHLGLLLDTALTTSRGRGRPVYCALRGYLMDLKGELAERGFSEIGEQELLIRYTTVTARAPAFDPVHFPVELRPALPRRVPTFLEGQPTDGAV